MIEIMIAVIILAFGIVGIIRSYSICISALGISSDYIDAICLSKEKMAEIELEKIESPALREGVCQGQFEGRYERFKWKTEIIPAGREDLSLVKVSISNERVNPVREFALFTYVYNKK